MPSAPWSPKSTDKGLLLDGLKNTRQARRYVRDGSLTANQVGYNQSTPSALNTASCAVE